MTKIDIAKVEELVNTQIRANFDVTTIETSQEKAKELGAEALFGEKYGDIVRVVSMGNFSVEFCGGTHIYRTGDIGLFKITSEIGISSGIRRVEALTAQNAINYIQRTENKVIAIKDAVKANDSNLFDKLASLQDQLKSQEKEIAKLKKDLLSSSNISIKELKYNSITVVVANIDGVDLKTLRDKIDDYRSRHINFIAILSTIVANKVQFVIGVSKSIISKIKAGDIAKELCSHIDGNGGGRPDMAQGGGNDISSIEEALSKVEKFIIDTIN